MVYFIQSGNDGPVKIGVSDDPLARVKKLQTGSPAPLNLLAVIPGGIEKERELHAMFAKFRTDREWFQPAFEIFAFIANLTPDNRLEIEECLVCGMKYLPNLPEDIAAHAQSHQMILRGALPLTVRELLKEQGWATARNASAGGAFTSNEGKRAIAFAWWARAREAGLPDANFEDYILTHLALVDAILTGDKSKQEEINAIAKTRWNKYG